MLSRQEQLKVFFLKICNFPFLPVYTTVFTLPPFTLFLEMEKGFF